MCWVGAATRSPPCSRPVPCSRSRHALGRCHALGGPVGRERGEELGCHVLDILLVDGHAGPQLSEGLGGDGRRDRIEDRGDGIGPALDAGQEVVAHDRREVLGWLGIEVVVQHDPAIHRDDGLGGAEPGHIDGVALEGTGHLRAARRQQLQLSRRPGDAVLLERAAAEIALLALGRQTKGQLVGHRRQITDRAEAQLIGGVTANDGRVGILASGDGQDGGVDAGDVERPLQAFTVGLAVAGDLDRRQLGVVSAQHPEAQARADIFGHQVDLARGEGLVANLAGADGHEAIDPEACGLERLGVHLRDQLGLVEAVRADPYGGLVLGRDDGAPTRRPDDRERSQDRRPEGESAGLPHGFLLFLR